ncbi:MAG: hypothetical protein WC211_10600, partial [Dehalococcoidia bacterium]
MTAASALAVHDTSIDAAHPGESIASRTAAARLASMPQARVDTTYGATSAAFGAAPMGERRLVPGALGRAVRGGVAVQRLAVRPAIAQPPYEGATPREDGTRRIASPEPTALAVASPDIDDDFVGAAADATVSRSSAGGGRRTRIATRALGGALPVAGAVGARVRLPMVSAVEGMRVAGS